MKSSTVKDMIKAILIAGLIIMGIIMVLFLPLVGYVFLTTDITEITTEYGDKFKIERDGSMGKWFLHDEYGSVLRLPHDFDSVKDMRCLCNISEIRCYLIDDEPPFIIYLTEESEGFQRLNLDGDYLYSHEAKVPAAKSILLIDNMVLREYLPYFIDKHTDETYDMLRNLVKGNYDELELYGLTDEIISDKFKLHRMQETAKQYLSE